MPLQHDAFECRASARAVVRNKLKRTGVAEPPKILGPGALIFVARQLDPIRHAPVVPRVKPQ